jgi:hypothetical protein
MAGVVVPSIVLLFVLTGFIIARHVYQVPIPIERAIVFPMGIVPSAFGVWNMFYLWLRPRRHLPIGFHGALLPCLLVPLGYFLGRSLGILAVSPNGLVYFQAVTIPYHFLAVGFTIGLIGNTWSASSIRYWGLRRRNMAAMAPRDYRFTPHPLAPLLPADLPLT